MPLTIEDDATVALVSRLARARGVTEAEAVRSVVEAELDRSSPETLLPAGSLRAGPLRAGPLRERLAALRVRYPLPTSTGLAADKAFFDELNGD